MRVLQLTKHYPPHFGGIETVTYDLTIGINHQNIQCDVLCCNNTNKTVTENYDGYTVERIARSGKISSTSISTVMLTRLKQIAPLYDVIHIHFPDPLTALALFMAKPKAKIVVHWHSDIIKQKVLLKFFMPLQNWLLKRADCIIATSQNYADHSEHLCPYLKKVIVVPIGINETLPGSDTVTLVNIKGRYPGKKIVFALGRLVYYKGFKYLVEAATQVNNDTVVIIGGTGPLNEELHALVDKYSLKDKVILTGKIPHSELEAYFKDCDIFCLPAIEKSEAFGVVILEAMQHGKPIITSNIPESGICWVNQHNITGYNIPPRQPVLLAEAINKLLNNKEQYELFSKNCLQRFDINFKSSQMVNTTIDIYKKLLS